MFRVRLICFAIALAMILPSGCGTAENAPTAATLRVMSYNIHHGEGTDGRIDLERIARLIKQERPDVVALQEIDRGVKRTDRRDLIKELSRLTGMEFYFDRNIIYQGGDYGNAVLTRFPILSKKNTHYKMLHPGEQRGVLQLVLDVHGKKIFFMATHIDYRPDDEERKMNVQELKKIVEQHRSEPIILCGDFNSEPDSRVYAELKEFVDDTWALAGKGPGFTFSSDQPEKRIDYIWISKNALLKPLKVWIPQTTASDHLPVMAELQVP